MVGLSHAVSELMRRGQTGHDGHDCPFLNCAAAELHLRLHEWGNRWDEDKRHNDTSAGTNY
ncbi:hypothetical protein SLEP1_g54170 [Rubroshorea leprosula]|uniref:Uncharacterized protein n=1 Tax=Rubroshorea leprosula TaxID=152421 RepID=A0AAV5MC03_9ROSI|nr:hypothetical protein SLEP1_g54170 [Rubroshorea leprosula]